MLVLLIIFIISLPGNASVDNQGRCVAIPLPAGILLVYGRAAHRLSGRCVCARRAGSVGLYWHDDSHGIRTMAAGLLPSSTLQRC
jgi:hypothetical protein